MSDEEKPGARLAASLVSVLGSKGQSFPSVAPPDRGYVMQPGEDSRPKWEPNGKLKRTRRVYSEEVKADAVAQALAIGRGGAEVVAKKLGCSNSIVSIWIKQARNQQMQPAAQPVATPAEPAAPAAPTLNVRIDGLEEYVERLVDERMLMRLRKIIGD